MPKTIYWNEYGSKKKAKKDFEKEIFKLKNNAVFGKAMENVRKDKDTKLFETEKGKDYLVPESNYQNTESFTKNPLAIEINTIISIL